MGLSVVAKAVEDLLAASWDKCEVRGLNGDTGTPIGGDAFLVVQYPVVRSERISFGSPGNNIYRDEGAFRLVLNIRRGDGIAEGLKWIDELSALFRGKTFDGVRTFAPSPSVIDDRNDEDGYFLLTTAVPFEHDYLG
ncbi:phage tail terminator-like protein [Methylobacterium sp. NMS14P]|uniref:phage tail terminator-like protein n=1 Tax=Methylobacterium sp. NMS14P TaxID=2894310 RepID=UPI002358CE7A|nr:phage tail terminator-like protein [Methylobacterium sp. NMS14P]WCS27790.1 phage tail terminator-like protein [Methylobacterium sp. NMS14P]